jgi:hypothetical protein
MRYSRVSFSTFNANPVGPALLLMQSTAPAERVSMQTRFHAQKGQRVNGIRNRNPKQRIGQVLRSDEAHDRGNRSRRGARLPEQLYTL